MNRLWKWAAVTAVVLAVFCCASAMADTSGTDGNIAWTLTDSGALTISGTGAMPDYAYSTAAPWGTAPTSVEIEYGVTSVGEYAFYNCADLASVSLPASVTSIGGHAFRACAGLTGLSLPDGVTSIGQYAFYECSNLGRINIPGSAATVGMHAFSNCFKLHEVHISSVESWLTIRFSDLYSRPGGDSWIRLYIGNTEVTNVIIPDSVTTISSYAFRSCVGITGVDIPDSVTGIGDSAFKDCTSLAGLEIPDSVTGIGNEAFQGCTSLTGLDIPDSVTGIGNKAFSGCTSLTGLDIPEGVTTIGSEAFSGCTSLVEVDIPASVTSIGANCFKNCTSLDIIYVTPGNEYYSSDWGVLFNADKTLLIAFPAGTTDEYEIPAGVTSIGENAFYNCAGLSEVTLPDSLTSIGKAAFSGCTGLTGVSIPDDVASIGSYAFDGCTSLAGADIPDSVTSIGSYAFRNCTSLTDIAIPKDVNRIETWCFNGCSRLKSVIVPDNVTFIGNGAFAMCSRLRKVCYTGTEEQWNSITIGSYNTLLTGASIRFSYVPHKEHPWGEPSYTWAEDNSTLTALHVCTLDPDHTETETVDVWSDVTLEPGCETMGQTTYTSDDFDNKAFEAQSKTLTNVPATGHDWYPVECEWADDYKTATATRDCRNDLSHVESETVSVTYVVTRRPESDVTGIVEYTAAFQNPVFGTFTEQESIPSLSNKDILYLPTGTEVIEDEAFYNTYADVVFIPQSCTYIGHRAFAYCLYLYYVEIPSSVATVEDDAFDGSPNVVICYVD
ncbi:MAG: leucine-rich repeat protein [Clostridia bacterium]|nr:leucine-rich repeat protein [Clostridia bacterium]